MPTITMTKFVDFAAANTAKKLQVVREALKQSESEYSPSTDYYRPLREAVVREFEAGWGPSSTRRLRSVTADPKKLENYALCVDGFVKWRSKAELGLSTRKSETWVAPGLTVRVNPELALPVNGEPHVIKLYFKADPLAASTIRTVLHLLRESFPDLKPGVFDARRGKLVTSSLHLADIDAALLGDAAHFAALWEALSAG